MTTSRFLRYMDLKDEWEALAPDRDKWERRMLVWAGLAVIIFIPSIFMGWWLVPLLWLAVGFYLHAQHRLGVVLRERADLLAEMRGLAYDPH